MRILSNIKKARRGAFASWEDRTPWEAIDKEWKTTAPFDDHDGARFTTAGTIGTDAGLRNFGPREPVVTAAHTFPPDHPLFSEHRFSPHLSDSNEDDRGPTSDHCPSATNHLTPAKQRLVEFFYNERLRSMGNARSSPAQNLPCENRQHAKASTSGPASPPDDRKPRREEGSLLQILKDMDSWIYKSDVSFELGPEPLLLRSAFVKPLDTICEKRAWLLQLLPGKPTLAPLSEPVGQILDIESAPESWPSIGKFACML